jgi:hypothetical protein
VNSYSLQTASTLTVQLLDLWFETAVVTSGNGDLVIHGVLGTQGVAPVRTSAQCADTTTSPLPVQATVGKLNLRVRDECVQIAATDQTGRGGETDDTVSFTTLGAPAGLNLAQISSAGQAVPVDLSVYTSDGKVVVVDVASSRASVSAGIPVSVSADQPLFQSDVSIDAGSNLIVTFPTG